MPDTSTTATELRQAHGEGQGRSHNHVGPARAPHLVTCVSKSAPAHNSKCRSADTVSTQRLNSLYTRFIMPSSMSGDASAADSDYCSTKPGPFPLRPLNGCACLQLFPASAPQGIDGHRSSLTKFAELLLLHGAINTQQLAIALELVDLVFDQNGAATCL